MSSGSVWVPLQQTGQGEIAAPGPHEPKSEGLSSVIRSHPTCGETWQQLSPSRHDDLAQGHTAGRRNIRPGTLGFPKGQLGSVSHCRKPNPVGNLLQSPLESIHRGMSVRAPDSPQSKDESSKQRPRAGGRVLVYIGLLCIRTTFASFSCT